MAQARPLLPFNKKKRHHCRYGCCFFGLVDVCIENFNSHFESSPLSLSLHLQMWFTGYANRQQQLVYFRDELLSTHFGSARLKLCPQILSHLEMNALPRYHGKRAGKSKGFLGDNKAIQVRNRLRHMPSLQRVRTWTLISLTFCDSPRPPTLSHLKPTTASFAWLWPRGIVCTCVVEGLICLFHCVLAVSNWYIFSVITFLATSFVNCRWHNILFHWLFQCKNVEV